MKIALIDPLAYTPPYDDALAAALAARGHGVHLLTSEFVHGAAPRAEGYAREELFLPLSSRLFRRAPRSRVRLVVKAVEYVPSVRRLLRRLDELAPDVVHVQWLPRPELDVRWLRRLTRPSVLTAHDVLPRRRRAEPAWREALTIVDRVVVHSARAVAQLVDSGLERERIARIAHPIFPPRTRALAPPQGRTLLFFGLLRTYKGLDLLVSALPSVPGARLIVAGDPVDPVEPLQRLARQLGVADRIEWRLGFLPEPELDEVLAAATVVVLPYRGLDSSGVLATALGHRRPVVVSDVGSLGELVREFGAGAVVPPEDVHALAQACTRLLDDPADAYAGTGRAVEALTWDAAAAAHERVYVEVAR